MVGKKNSKQPSVYVVAVTGGIGSGKTTVCNIFKNIFNTVVIDTDQLAKNAVSVGSKCLDQIVGSFGNKILDKSGNLNRSMVKKMIFEDSNLRTQLEEIIHPEIGKLTLQAITKINSPYCLLGIPLLSNKQNPLINRILVVDCEEEEQIKRTSLRDNLNRSDISKIISTQPSRDERLKIADDVICNRGSVSYLETEVRRLNTLYMDLSAKADAR